MQGKGIIKAFAAILILVSLYQLSFTFLNNKNQKQKNAYVAEKIANLSGSDTLSSSQLRSLRARFKRQYADSTDNKKVFLGYTNKKIRDQAINLGLDLKGGLNMILEVDASKILESLSYESPDHDFNQALKKAKEMQSSSNKDFLTLFVEAYEKENPSAKLASIFAPLQKYQNKIRFESSNKDVIKVLREDVDNTIQNTFNVIKNRIDQYGVSNANLSFQKSTGRIVVEIPGVDDPERVKELLQKTAKLEFWDVFDNQEVIQSFVQANNLLATTLKSKVEQTQKKDKETPSDTDSLDIFSNENNAEKDSTSALNNTSNPLFDVLFLNVNEQGVPLKSPIVAYVSPQNRAKVEEYLNYDQIKALFRSDSKILWSAKPNAGGYYALYVIKKGINNEAPLTGESIIDASVYLDQIGNPGVSMNMNAAGRKKWTTMTTEAVGNLKDESDNKSIAIVMDNIVYSAPVVQSIITGGSSQISGGFGYEEATDLANTLKSGNLDAPAKIIQYEEVGPSMGRKGIRAGLSSLVGGLFLVLIFMILYYNKAGVIADIALLLNMLLIMGALSSIKGVALTLAGMAGIVLTVGMAVDANVIIFERIKEELSKGKGLLLAISDGYKHSFSAIIDANVTTLITAAVLYIFSASSAVKGFGLVLMIGIFISFFTAVVVSRLIFENIAERSSSINFATSLSKRLLRKTHIDFLSKKKVGYMISGAVITIGIICILISGFNLGVDFKGGRSYIVQLDQNVPTDVIKSSLNEIFKDASTEVKTYGSDDQVQVTTTYLYESGQKTASNDSLVLSKLHQGIKNVYKTPPSYTYFVDTYLQGDMNVDTSIADDLRSSSIWVAFLAAMGIFFYLFIRFNGKWQFGFGAIIAVLHDSIIVLSLFSIFKNILPFSLEINQAFIAAILTVIGYSINDTVVIFDRIREFLHLHPKNSLTSNVNNAINSTLSRTLMTSITTLLVVLILFIFGGPAIKGFSFALLIGILVGTYSSIFVATPITIDLLNKKGAASK